MTPRPTPLPDDLLPVIQKHAIGFEIANRQAQLAMRIVDINHDLTLTDPDRAALLSLIHAAQASLSVLSDKIFSDATADQAHADAERIVSDFHVYAFIEPQVAMVRASDALSDVAKILTTQVVPELSADIDSAPNLTPEKRQALHSALGDVAMHAAAAQTTLAALSSTLLAQNEAGYPGNAAALRSARASIASARSDLGTARHGADGIVTALPNA